MTRLLALVLLLLATESRARAYIPRYAVEECPQFIRKQADDSGADISCGYLTVPEDHDATESSRLIELFVVRIAVQEPAGNAPLIHLAGGPGSPVANRIEGILQSQLHHRYEIIAIDQRGAGFSLPSLDCRERNEQAVPADIIWIRDCRLRLIGDGIDLGAYNSASIARDIHAILIALQINEANIYGYSYGARLALTLARDYPNRLRAVILDGVLPLQVNRLEAHAPNGHRAFERLFDSCADDAKCRSAYPHLRETFLDVISRLNQTPAKIEFERENNLLVLTGDDFVNESFTLLYDKGSIPYLPWMIDAFANGEMDFVFLADARNRWSQSSTEGEPRVPVDDLSEGAWLSVRCADEIPFNSREQIVNKAARLPGAVRRALVDYALGELDSCQAWKAPRAAPVENQPVISDIPTLLLSGRFDPVTPPEWGDDTARFLETSWHYVFPDAGHGVLFEPDADCAESIALSFLANPKRQPDAACLSELTPPDFYVRP
jgi:pimeloyl-ACP methyl ester carboxylesterase